MQTEKIVALNTINKVQVQYGTIESIDDKGYQIVDASERYHATRAFSCFVEPIHDDIVMFSIDAGRQCHILSIIERPGTSDAQLAFPGDVTMSAKHGQLQLHGQQGINISSDKSINQTSEGYSVLAKNALFSIDTISAVGTKLLSRVSNIHTVADTVETVAGTLLQKLKNSIRIIDGVDQKKSHDVINTVENLYSLRSKQTAILAKKDIKMDAERIHMG